MNQSNDKSDTRREYAAETLDRAADSLREKSGGRPNGKLRQYSGKAAEGMSTAADYLRNHDAQAMWRDIEQLVRRYPGQAMTAALALGLLAGQIIAAVSNGDAMTVDARPVSELLREIVSDIRGIIRSEVRLVSVELQRKGSKASDAAKLTAIGAGLGLYAGGALVLAIIWAISLFVSAWIAAAITAAVLGIPSLILVRRGIRDLKGIFKEGEWEWNRKQNGSNARLNSSGSN